MIRSSGSGQIHRSPYTANSSRRCTFRFRRRCNPRSAVHRNSRRVSDKHHTNRNRRNQGTEHTHRRMRKFPRNKLRSLRNGIRNSRRVTHIHHTNRNRRNRGIGDIPCTSRNYLNNNNHSLRRHNLQLSDTPNMRDLYLHCIRRHIRSTDRSRKGCGIHRKSHTRLRLQRPLSGATRNTSRGKEEGLIVSFLSYSSHFHNFIAVLFYRWVYPRRIAADFGKRNTHRRITVLSFSGNGGPSRIHT